MQKGNSKEQNHKKSIHLIPWVGWPSGTVSREKYGILLLFYDVLLFSTVYDPVSVDSIIVALSFYSS